MHLRDPAATPGDPLPGAARITHSTGTSVFEYPQRPSAARQPRPHLAPQPGLAERLEPGPDRARCRLSHALGSGAGAAVAAGRPTGADRLLRCRADQADRAPDDDDRVARP